MRKRLYKYYRYPKTRQEKRANLDKEYVRRKRAPNNLPDAYDDLPCLHTKSWKDKRTRQYRVGKRGARHSLFVRDTRRNYIWLIERYCETHDIPFHYRSRVVTKHNEDGSYGKHLGWDVFYWSSKKVDFGRLV